MTFSDILENKIIMVNLTYKKLLIGEIEDQTSSNFIVSKSDVFHAKILVFGFCGKRFTNVDVRRHRVVT